MVCPYGWSGGECQGVEQLHNVPVRHVVVALPLLFLHNLALSVQIFLSECIQQRGHPVRLQPQREVKSAGRQRLEVVGPIEPGGGIDHRAGCLQQRNMLAGRDVRRALKHHVLEEMGEAGTALLLISGADVVPDIHRDRRR